MCMYVGYVCKVCMYGKNVMRYDVMYVMHVCMCACSYVCNVCMYVYGM